MLLKCDLGHAAQTSALWGTKGVPLFLGSVALGSPQEGCWPGRGACPHFWAHPDPPWWRRCCVTARAARVWVNCGVNLPMFGPVLEIILWQTAEGTDLRSLYLHWDSWCQPWKYIHVKKKKVHLCHPCNCSTPKVPVDSVSALSCRRCV